jgi:hypothetical protein
MEAAPVASAWTDIPRIQSIWQTKYAWLVSAIVWAVTVQKLAKNATKLQDTPFHKVWLAFIAESDARIVPQSHKDVWPAEQHFG